jgi:hypothetical protein
VRARCARSCGADVPVLGEKTGSRSTLLEKPVPEHATSLELRSARNSPADPRVVRFPEPRMTLLLQQPVRVSTMTEAEQRLRETA